MQGFLAVGLQRTTAGLGSVIIDSQPLTVAVLAALLFGEKLTAASYAGLGLGVLGLSLLEVPVDILATVPQTALGTARSMPLPRPHPTPPCLHTGKLDSTMAVQFNQHIKLSLSPDQLRVMIKCLHTYNPSVQTCRACLSHRQGLRTRMSSTQLKLERLAQAAALSAFALSNGVYCTCCKHPVLSVLSWLLSWLLRGRLDT